MTEGWMQGRSGLLSSVGFPRGTSVKPGDELVYYAIGPRKIIARVRVVTTPRLRTSISGRESQWNVRCDVEPIIAIAELNRAPSLEEIDAGERPAPISRSVTQKSHIRLNPGEYDLAVGLLDEAHDASLGDWPSG